MSFSSAIYCQRGECRLREDIPLFVKTRPAGFERFVAQIGISKQLHLPTELCIVILRYAAAPSFAIDHLRHTDMKPYSSALALCLVSKAFRLYVIPELLHTIYLPTCKHVLAFTHALQIQRAYAQEGNHLHVDYAAQVRCIWMENCSRIGCRNPNSLYFRPVNRIRVDYSLLAPVVLASKSLRVDDGLMFILDGCLEHAWNACSPSDIHYESSPLPWSVETLTVSQKDIASYHRDSASRATKQYSFLTSISHILIREYLCPTDSIGIEKTLCYKTPECSYDTPWACLKNLRFISFGNLHSHNRFSGCGGRLRVELLITPDPMNLQLNRCAQGRISSVDCRATVTCTECFPDDELTCLLCWRYKRQ